MKTVVFIETNFSGLDAIRYCTEQGYRAVLVTDSLERFRKWFPASCMSKLDLADTIIQVGNSNDFDEVRQVLEDELGTVDALLTFAEIRTHVTARLCAALGLPGANPDAIAIAQDKHRFRQVLLEKGADDVHCRKIDRIDRLQELKAELAFPCFLKPLQGHSSIGATVCADASQVERVVASLRGITEDWISAAFVAEDYLQGDLVSVELLTTGPGQHQVVGVADRDVIKDSIEIGSSFPVIDARRDAAIRKACMALDAIGYDFGPSHVEIIVTASGPHLVEVNTRVGGSGHSVMLDLATSRSIVGDCVELCLGNLVACGELYRPTQGAAWKCFVSEATGIIRQMPPVEAIRDHAGVKEVWLHHEAGDQINSLSSNYSWIVQVMCTGKDRQEAKRNAARAIDFVAAHTVIA
ncbi:ATP-grasp domain-containing protein [Noviherbaspirillum sp.]|uniref:ATP-grasp domain-containing protein n=1 Tax=Noviherbaspirillum sp. TaxID=1926288 RepID=UPI002D4E6185|nr:ATP-grasp domain-containing protein [Noviherbaspirillum sp.]HZW21742.1 ATP-grasp domain-containing protein [Noviherbaspirillum sp.]